MARPSKLPQNKKEEMIRRHIAGDTMDVLAKCYKVSKATVFNIVSERTKTQKCIAKQLATVELVFEGLPVTEQVNVRSMADNLKDITTGLASAACSSSRTAARISALAEKHSHLIEGDLQRINESATGKAEIDDEALKTVMKLSQVAGEASKIPLNLLAANKEAIKDMNEVEVADIPTDLGFLYGE